MKKLILIITFVFGAIQVANAQLDFGIKAGINYNFDAFKKTNKTIDDFETDTKTGYHAGIWVRANIPAIGLYIRPELVYTALKSDIKSKTTSIEGKYNFQKIDLPVLLGKNFLQIAHVYVGPSFQYIIDGDVDYGDLISETNSDGFTIGMQLGAGVEISKFGFDIRWERGFTNVESEAITKIGSIKNGFDTRVNQIILSFSYKF